MSTTPEDRQAAAGDVIALDDGRVVHTFAAGQKSFEIGIHGRNVRFTVAKPPKQTDFSLEQLSVRGGTDEAELWVDDGSGGKIYTRLAKSTRLFMPGRDLMVNVVAATPTPVPPPPPPPAPVDVMPSPPPGVQVVRVGDQATTLALKSNTWYAPSPGRTKFTINAATGIHVPSGTVNAAVFGAECVGKGDAGYGIDARGTTGIKNVAFQGGSCRDYTDGLSVHGANIEGACVHHAVTLRDWRMLDMAGNLDNEGQGIYAANVDGLLIEECFGDRLGAGAVSIFTHFAYIAAGCRNVIVRRNLISRAEANGIMCRGPLVRYTDPDDGKDPGPQIIDNVLYDCAIGITVNGPRAAVRTNAIVTGHHSDQVNTLGEVGIYASVGQLRMTGNLRLHSPVKDTGTVLGAWFNNPRGDYALQGGVKYQWGWSKACGYAENAGNIDRNGVVVDLSELVTRGRNGEPIGPLVDAALAKCKAAAGAS